MDAILPMFLAACALEFGDRTQRLAALLAGRYRRPLAVLAGILLAAAILAGVAAAGGAIVARTINHRAITLLLGLALIAGGSGALTRPKPPEPIAGWKLGAFWSSAGAFLILAAGDKTMFATLAFAAHGPAPVLTASASAAGVLAASVPAVLRGENWLPAGAMRATRIGLGAALMLAGGWIALGAIGLI